MNRLTAIGLASLVAYGVLLASKYTGVISVAHEREPTSVASHDDSSAEPTLVASAPAHAQASPRMVPMPTPLPRMEPTHASAIALEFRATRDLRSFADALEARRDTLTADERYFLAKALEECAFATAVNEDLAGSINRKRIAAYDAMDNPQRCLRFQGTRISSKEIEGLVADAAQQGDPRAQARLLISDLTNKVNSGGKTDGGSTARATGVSMDDISQLIRLLETRDPETTIQVGNFLASSAMVTLSRNRRCTRPATIRRNQPAIADSAKATTAIAMRRVSPRSTPSAINLNQSATSESGSADSTANPTERAIRPGSCR